MTPAARKRVEEAFAELVKKLGQGAPIKFYSDFESGWRACAREALKFATEFENSDKERGECLRLFALHLGIEEEKG